MSGTKILNAEQFAKLRAKIQAEAAKPTRVAKARTTNNRPKAAAAPTTWPTQLYIPKPDPAADARHAFRAVPGRAMALDLSMAKTGIAWGKPGCKPEGTLCIVAGSRAEREKEGEQATLYSMAHAIAGHAAGKQCAVAIFSEFYAANNMLSFRANVALRGAVMVELARYGIRTVSVPEITARKAAGVDIRKMQPGEQKGYMKDRARQRLEALGLGHLQEDEGDAALLLLGSCGVLGLPIPSPEPPHAHAPQAAPHE